MQSGFISVGIEMDVLKREVKDVKLDKPDHLVNVQGRIAVVRKELEDTLVELVAAGRDKNYGSSSCTVYTKQFEDAATIKHLEK